MRALLRWLGSLTMAIVLLIAIAVVLAWGTIYEARFGTAAVQQFIYHSWWFQVLLGFLAVNLAIAAFERYPWKRVHIPFVLAHLGIILILVGGIIGGRFGIDGQLIIPEGQAERMLQMPYNVLVVRQPNPGVAHVLRTNFEATAWVHEPHTLFQVPLERRTIQLVVDRYYPDAQTEERITDDGTTDNPAVHVSLSEGEQQDEMWLLAKDPERFGARWGQAHLLFLEPETEQQLAQLMGRSSAPTSPRGVVSISLPGETKAHDIPVPEQLGQSIPITGTPYTVTFKDYFPDFALDEQGPVSRSDQPNNPAVAFTLSGPEGTDAHLLFALHPEFAAIHGRTQTIRAQVRYAHEAGSVLPPDAIALIRLKSGGLAAALTGGDGQVQQRIESLAPGTRYTHPSLGYGLTVEHLYPRAKVTRWFTNRSDDVHAEALHVMAQEGKDTADGWVGLGGSLTLPLGTEPVIVEYKPDEQPLPVTIKLLDFRKTDYPGTQMAASFESDVELTDPQRGIILMRKISMNNPLRYRGFTFYQSSYVPGPTETTILSVRNDPGTPLVYAGFLIVIAGIVSMFLFKTTDASSATPKPKRRKRGAK